jgi:biotin transport system substrate-specific component
MISNRTDAIRRMAGEGLAGEALRLLTANLLLVLCAKIAFPLPFTPVPLTLQTFGVLVVGVLFGARTSALAAAIYLMEGALGAPVFQPFGAPGAARLLGPTAGYLLAYPPAAFAAGWLVDRARRGAGKASTGGSLPVLFGALLPAEALILVCGWAWLATIVGPAAALAQGVVPFLPGDVLKLATAAGVARMLGAGE